MMNTAMGKESGHSLMIDSAPQTNGALCILCLSHNIREQDTNLSMQRFSSFKSMADTLSPDFISFHKLKSGLQCKYLLNRVTEKHLDQNNQEPQKLYPLHFETQNINICINCINIAQQQLKKAIKHRESLQPQRRLNILSQKQLKRKSRSAHSKFILQSKKSFFAHDDQSNSQSENVSGNSDYLSKVAYGNDSFHLKPSKIKNALNQQDQITNAHSQTKTSPKLILHEEKKEQFMKEFLALESNDETEKKQTANFKKSKPLQKLIIQGFPKNQTKRPNNIHKSIETFVQKVKIKIIIPKIEEVCCKYCQYQLQKCCAIESRIQSNAWVCRTCFTLNEEQMKLLSFDRKRNEGNAEVSRKKRAQTLSKYPRKQRQNIQFLPYSRNGRILSQNIRQIKQIEAVNQCVVCQKKGVTLVKQKGKSYCIYCYYNHRHRGS